MLKINEDLFKYQENKDSIVLFSSKFQKNVKKIENDFQNDNNIEIIVVYKEDNEELFIEFGVEKIPTIIFFSKLVEIDRIENNIDYLKVKKMIDEEYHFLNFSIN